MERKNQEIEQARGALKKRPRARAQFTVQVGILGHHSHELRALLNSILILGQQLADNPDGNLASKQVECARTIHAAGTDLLNLISDILDLSKIESGTVTVDIEEVFITNLFDTIARPFRTKRKTGNSRLTSRSINTSGAASARTQSACSSC